VVDAEYEKVDEDSRNKRAVRILVVEEVCLQPPIKT
jgi:hypothetical protein